MTSSHGTATRSGHGNTPESARVLFIGAPILSYNHPGWTIHDRFCAYGMNTGNLLIGDSLREELKISRFEFPPGLPPDGANENFDAIVVPAANFIFKGFDLTRYADFIEATNLPCVVAGLGAQAPHAGLKPTDLPEGSKRFLKIISERSKVIGVRGNFTAEVMHDLGITNVRPIGCPSLFRSLTRDLHIRRPRPGRDLKVSLNGSRDTIAHMRSPDAARRVEAALIRLSMTEGHGYVLQSEMPEIALLTAEDITGEQKKQVDRLCGELGMAETADKFVDHVRRNGRLFFDLRDWDNYIRAVDLSIGSRLHGNLIALTNGTPAVILNHDSRTTEIAELMGIPHVFTEDLLEIDPAKLLERADFDGFEARYRKLYDRFADFLTENGLPHHLEDARPVANPDSVLPAAGRIVRSHRSDPWKRMRSVLGNFSWRAGAQQ